MKLNFKYNLKLNRIKVICEVCHNKNLRTSQLEQHRILPTGTYDSINVIIVCDYCHKKIHKTLERLINPSFEQCLQIVFDLEFELMRSSKNKKCVHKLVKSGPVWKCAVPLCTFFCYFKQSYILLGRATICWGCLNEFPLDEEAMKLDMPMCHNCINPPEDNRTVEAFLAQKKLENTQ